MSIQYGINVTINKVKQYFHVYNVDICMYVCGYSGGGGKRELVLNFILYTLVFRMWAECHVTLG